LLARAARDAIVPSVRAILDRHDATPGLVVSIQTFGSYAANFHPHVHALVTDGAFTEEGEFLQLPYFDARPTPPASPRQDRRTGGTAPKLGCGDGNPYPFAGRCVVRAVIATPFSGISPDCSSPGPP